MKTATITFTDNPNGTVNVSILFGTTDENAKLDEDSSAHITAARVLEFLSADTTT